MPDAPDVPENPSPVSTDPNSQILHATTIAHCGHAAVIRGKSGSGKSGLALQLIALGATLVSDDRTLLTNTGGILLADAPQTLHGRIEARGIGILKVPAAGPSPVSLIIDLDSEETERLPAFHSETIMGKHIACIKKSYTPHFPASILLYLSHGRSE